MMDKKKLGLGLLFLIVVGFSFLMFFGFSDEAKSEAQIARFIFIIIDEVVLFGSLFLTSGMEKTNAAGIVGLAAIYFVISLVFNLLIGAIISSVRILVVLNVAVLLVFLAIFALDLFSQKN